MKLIQKYLPDPRHTEVTRIFVKAGPQQAWQSARHFDASTLPWVQLLFDIRTLPDVLRGKSKPADNRIGIDQITASGTGFFLAEEDPGREVVVASIGQFWQLNIPFANVDPRDFTAFQEKGWGKLAWGFAVEPYRDGSTICLELRTTATDEESWHKLRNYYSVIGLGSRFIRHAGMHQLEKDLAKMEIPSDNEIELAGDNIIPESKYSITFGVNIEAPVALVWNYLMQLGCDRAGWYSIDLLDHGGVPSVAHLVPGWESREAGDKISATPALDRFFNVYEVKEHQHLVIGGETERLGGPFKMSWTFVLEPVGEHATRLRSRVRGSAEPRWADWLMGHILYPPLHALMTGVQLNTLRKYAERDARRHSRELIDGEFKLQ